MNETTRFAWIDVMGAPFVEIEARVIFGDGPEDGHVLVDAPTRDRMAQAIIETRLLSAEDDATWAATVRAIPAAPEDYPDLFDATDLMGGWLGWHELTIESDPRNERGA